MCDTADGKANMVLALALLTKLGFREAQLHDVSAVQREAARAQSFFALL